MSTEEEQKPTKPESYVWVQFAAPGSVYFALDMDGVTPLQMLALSAFFELKGKNALIQQENQRAEDEAQKSIARPKLVLPGQ